MSNELTINYPQIPTTNSTITYYANTFKCKIPENVSELKEGIFVVVDIISKGGNSYYFEIPAKLNDDGTVNKEATLLKIEYDVVAELFNKPDAPPITGGTLTILNNIKLGIPSSSHLYI